MPERDPTPYDPFEDFATRYLDWSVIFGPMPAWVGDPTATEMFDTGAHHLIINAPPRRRRFALAHAIVHLDFDHLGGDYLTLEQEQVATGLAKLKLGCSTVWSELLEVGQ